MTYRGMFFTDGVTDQGVKVIPLQTEGSQNAQSMFKQCLFRVEVQQACEVNQRAHKLLQQKIEVENRLRKLIVETGGKENQEVMNQLKLELELI